MTNKTSRKHGRATAPAEPIALPNTTRRDKLGAISALDMGGKKPAHRFNAADLATLAPSVTAIELATCLKKPEAFLADFRAACHTPKKHELTPDEAAKVADLKKSRNHSPSQREDLIKAIREQSRRNRNAVLRECRINAKRWIALVRLYEKDRARLWSYPPIIRDRLIRDIAAGVHKAASNDVRSFDRAERRRRAANRKGIRRAAENSRKCCGYRKARPMVPMTPEGEVDCLALAAREMLWLSASGINTGVSIAQVQDRSLTTEDRRIAKRLSDEARKFITWKRDRSV